jgi:hypothetical protein
MRRPSVSELIERNVLTKFNDATPEVHLVEDISAEDRK